jgi:hypothetical protein
MPLLRRNRKMSWLSGDHLGGSRQETFREVCADALNACGDLSRAGDHRPPKTTGLPVETRFVLVEDEHVFPLHVGLNTLGRLPDNDVPIAEEHVSRRHCVITIHSSGAAEISDLASRNGTILNGTKIEGTVPLMPGDEIQLYTRCLVFQSLNGQEEGEFQTLRLHDQPGAESENSGHSDN